MFQRFIIFTYLTYCINLIAAVGYKNLSQASSDFWDETEPFGQDVLSSKKLRLSPDIAPSFYRLKKKIDLDHSIFTGEVYITLKANKNLNKIILHAKDLSISNNVKLTEQIYEKVETFHSLNKSKRNVNGTMPNYSTTESNLEIMNTSKHNIQNDLHNTQVTHSNVRNIQILSIKSEKIGDRLILNLGSDLQPGIDYILELSFNGTITENLTGFYKSTYVDNNQQVKQMGVTQFEPTSARAAFPCFDQPEFKAKFEISIAHRKQFNVLCNMKVSSEEDIQTESDWKWTHFERSVDMSTYLVAYVLSEFPALETSYKSKDNITKYIKIWTRPGLLSKAKYALSITPKLLEFYENVFGVPYALDKIDLIAVPDFSSGAMENWGLMTFRETTLLFDEKENIPRDKQTVAINVAHELAHQWFGNLVTMSWWTDLWLNEGFATYIEYVGVDHIEPEWNILDSFTTDKMNLLKTDALKNTSPVSKEVIDASEISQKFDEISYAKGASLIRMLNHTITNKLFQKGLLHYLNQWKYTNAEENDLWLAMSEVTKSDPTLKDISVVKFMNTWTKQAGYPVVNVHRNYFSGKTTFEQKLFSTAKQPYQSMLHQLWHIPLSYTTVSTPTKQWTTKPKLWLKDKSVAVNIAANSSEALYVNIDAIGYYRVNYDSKNWELLSIALKNGQVTIPLTRAQLIDDAFNLAKVSQLDYSYVLNLTTYIIDGEDSIIVWDLLLDNMSFLKLNLRTSRFYIYFQDYVKKLLNKQLIKLNYGLMKPKDDNEAFLIENLVMWECYMESPRCLDWAKDEFTKWTTQPDVNNNTIPSYLRQLVYTMALRHGGRREFDFLWNIYENSTDPMVKNTIISVLSSTRVESLIALLLEKSLTDVPTQYAPALWSYDSLVGYKMAQDFLIKNWHRVYKKFSQTDAFLFPAILNGAFGFITQTDELNKLKEFALEHKDELMPISQTLQKLVDTANLRITWLQKHLSTIEKWLKDYISGDNSVQKVKSTTVGAIRHNTNDLIDLYAAKNDVQILSTTPDSSNLLRNHSSI